MAADIDEDGGRATVAQAGGRPRFVRADMTVADDVRALIRSSEPAILVNNAGVGGHIPPHFPDATPEQWGATLDLNLRGPMPATQPVLAPMRAAGGGVAGGVLRLIRDDSLAGRALLLRRGEPPRLL